MSTNVISVFFMSLVLASCAFTTEEAKREAAKKEIEVMRGDLDTETRETIQDVKLAPEDLHVEFFETETPGIYKYVLSWPKRAKFVYVGNSRGGHTSLDGSFTGQIEHSHTDVLRVDSKNDKGISASDFLYTIEAPEDLIVRENMVLTTDRTFNVRNVYFFAGKKVETNGYHLTINTESIWVENAEELCKQNQQLPFCGSEYPSRINIQTTLPGIKGTNEKQFTGSDIQIYATKSVQGTLRVAAIGFSGNDGASGASINKMQGFVPEIVDSAKNGAHGVAGSSKTESSGCFGGNVSLDIPCVEQTYKVCTKEPTNGGDGLKGKNGTDGEPGQDGGKSANVTVKVSPHNFDFTVKVWVRPGVGGIGGEGAEGYAGGVPGKAGHSPEGCKKARDGHAQGAGDKGKNGANGSVGEKGSVKVTGAQQVIEFL